MKKLFTEVRSFADNWLLWSLAIIWAAYPYWNGYIEPNGPYPASTWWWLRGASLFVIGVRLIQFIQIKRRMKRLYGTWKHPDVIPWSMPLRMTNGQPLAFAYWWEVSSGQTAEEIAALMNPPSYARQVAAKKYEDYLKAFKLVYS